MAEIIKNEKGFKILKVTVEEIFSWGGFGICDLCGQKKTENYLVPVLNRCLCDSCYNEWMERATNYPEDRFYENKIFTQYVKFLNIELKEE